MNEGGWVKAHRAMLSHPLLSQADELGLWMRLLLMATHRPERVRLRGALVTIDRGQAAVVMTDLAKRLGITRKRLRLIVDSWVADGMLKMGHAKGHAFTLVTICNFDTYQTSEDAEGPSLGPQWGQGGAKKGPTDQETKNLFPTLSESNSNTEITPHTPHEQTQPAVTKPRAKRAACVDPSFDLFWTAYPRRESRAKAIEAWGKATAKASLAEIMAGLDRSKTIWREQERPPDKIPMATTWLNQERWTDEPSTPLAPPPRRPIERSGYGFGH